MHAGNRPFLLREAIPLLDHLARGLSVAHDQGVAHRDIKPSNVFLSVQRGKLLAKVLIRLGEVCG